MGLTPRRHVDEAERRLCRREAPQAHRIHARGPARAPPISARCWRAIAGRPGVCFLIAIVGEALTDDERVIFRALTGRISEPLEPVQEFWAVIGRRGGKTRAMAILAALFGGLHRSQGHPGSRRTGRIPLLAASVQQAANGLWFRRGRLRRCAELQRPCRRIDIRHAVSSKTGIDISVRPASFRTIGGITAVAVICDEIAFWRSDDSANPDKEILKALRPSTRHDRRPADCHFVALRKARRALRNVQASLKGRPAIR